MQRIKTTDFCDNVEWSITRHYDVKETNGFITVSIPLTYNVKKHSLITNEGMQ